MYKILNFVIFVTVLKSYLIRLLGFFEPCCYKQKHTFLGLLSFKALLNNCS